MLFSSRMQSGTENIMRHVSFQERYKLKAFRTDFSTLPSHSSKSLLPSPRHAISRARTAELLLISRLKARSLKTQDAEMLERAAHIVFVTCKNWFKES